MGVKVVKGRCGSGKSRFLLKHIKKLIRDPFAKVIVIVPGQLTFETEKNIISHCGKKGILGLQVFSIQRLAYKILEDTCAVAFLTHAEQAMLCSKALSMAGDVYHGAAQTKDFELCMADLVTRLKSYRQTPESLLEAVKKTRDAALRASLTDTADVYAQYLKLCGGRYDAADMYAVAAGKVAEAAFLQNAHVVIDGMDSYCPAVLHMIGEVMRHANNTVAAFRSEGGGSDTDLFASERGDMVHFIEAAKRTGLAVEEVDIEAAEPRHSSDALRFFETNLYKYPYDVYKNEPDGIRLMEADSIAHEVDMLCAGILSEIGQGRRFRDIAVAAGGIDAYAPMLKTRLQECGIPFFIDERRPLRQNTFFDFVYKAMRAAAGDVMAVFDVVFSRYAPIDADQQRVLRKYVGEYAYQGWHMRSQFWRGDDAAKADAVRWAAMQPLLQLEDGMKGSVKRQTNAVLRFLKACDAEKKLTDYCDELSALGQTEQAAYFAQVYEKTAEVLHGIADIFGDAQLPPQEFYNLFETGCAATKIAVIPPTTDEVGIFDISLVRLKSIDVLFALGVQDGVWPATDDVPGIFSPSERDALKEAGVDIGVYDLAAEKLKIYTALVRPKERLYISYNRDSGQPSVLVDRIRRLFPALEVEKDGVAMTSASGMKSDVLGSLAEAMRGGDADGQMLRVCAHYIKQKGWPQTARDILLRTNEAKPMDEQTALRLYGGIRCSATRIENYYKCPFRHFLDYGIKPHQLRDYVGDRIDIGTYMHLALDLFAQGLIGDGADIRELTRDQVTRRMQAAANTAAAQHENGKMRDDERFAVMAALLERELVSAALRIQAHFDGSEARIISSEQAFADFTVTTRFGDISISGKIDRIDASGEYFRVVDYKSSQPKFSLADFMGGVALQLPVYIEAAKRLLKQRGEARKPSGGYYMRIGDTFAESGDAVRKKARMTGISLEDPDVLKAFSALTEDNRFAAIDQAVIRSGALHSSGKNKYFSQRELDTLLETAVRLIHDAAEAIYQGDIALRPAVNTGSGDACAYCDYGAVCMYSGEYDGNDARVLTAVSKEDMLKEAVR